MRLPLASELMERRDREEIANSITHALGTLLAIAAAVFLIVRTQSHPNPFMVWACAAYALSLVCVFFSSTMSHWAVSETNRAKFRSLDQGFIYLLIVATYTPFSIAYQNDQRGWIVLLAMWTIALAGFTSKVFLSHRIHRVSIVTYIVLGWMPVLAGWPSSGSVPVQAVMGILAGGIIYTAGVWFLMNDYRTWYMHSIWHILVIAAATIHFLTTVTWVIAA